jgi:hypothetical protein
MDLEENVAEKWKEQLHTTEKPAELLSTMANTVMGLTGNHIITMRKLVKIYGRMAVYYSILDTIGMTVEGDPLRLLSFFCKKRLEAKPVPNNIISVDEIKEKIAEMKEVPKEVTKIGKLRMKL